MSYQPKTWENKPSTASPINATNLNHMEGGIKNNNDDIIGAQNAILTLQGEMLQAQGDISALETLVDSIFPVDSASGNPAVITDAFGGAAKSLKLTLEPIQGGSGTPSPQNVRPISGRTQSVVMRTGKNVYDKNATDKTQHYFIIPDTGETTYSVNWSISGYIKTEEGLSYALSGMNNLSTNRYTVAFYDKNKTFIRAVASQNMTFTIPSGEGIEYIRFDYKNADENTIQLEIGSTATTYEAYNGETITRTYGTTIYGGTDDVTGEGVTVTKGLYVPLVTSVGYSSSAGCYYADCGGVAIIADADTICNMYDQIPYASTGAEGKYKLYSTAITIYDSRFTDVATAQSILNSCQIAYPLVTPTSIPLTAQNITLLQGDNVLTTDANSIEASYSADIALYIDKKIAAGSQNNRSLSKGGSGDEEVKEEVKEEEIEIKEAEPLTKEVR